MIANSTTKYVWNGLGLSRRLQTIGKMNEPPLHVADLVRCPHCRRWHPAIQWHNSGTDYTLRMLYFRHNGQMFYAGQEGLESRHETRAVVAPTCC